MSEHVQPTRLAHEARGHTLSGDGASNSEGPREQHEQRYDEEQDQVLDHVPRKRGIGETIEHVHYGSGSSSNPPRAFLRSRMRGALCTPPRSRSSDASTNATRNPPTGATTQNHR